jgi:hypothetical protein
MTCAFWKGNPVSTPARVRVDSPHFVTFYAAEDELIHAVARHVVDGPSGAVVVATAAHRQAIEKRVTELGADRSRPPADTMVMLDAEETLGRFFDGERIDPALFDEVIGGLIRRSARPGASLHVYGEMVAVLWEAGRVTAALELERLWNELATTVHFSLLCGYPTHSSLAGEDAIKRVREAHTSVLGSLCPPGTEVSRAFERDAGTPAEVRRFVTTTLRDWHADDHIDDVVLVADELVTNALVHACSDVDVTLAYNSASIRVAVADRSPVAPRPADRGAAATSGRGLHIVDILSSAWGHQPNGSGKIVWARFDGQFTTS